MKVQLKDVNDNLASLNFKILHFVGECDFKQENMGQKHKNDVKFHNENLESKRRQRSFRNMITPLFWFNTTFH